MGTSPFAVIDSGTTGTRCTIYDENLNVLGYHYIKNKNFYPATGWVEQDPESIYKNARYVFNRAVENAKIEREEIREIGLTNQRETIIGWNKNTGLPVYNAISWQDNRTADIMEKMNRSDVGELIRQKTGLLLNPYFSALKIKWIIDHKGLNRMDLKDIVFGTVDSWLVWKFTNGKYLISDYTNSSRTMLMNLRMLEWDDEILSYFKLEPTNLPSISPSFGNLRLFAEKVYNIPITSVIGDQQSALLGEGCFVEGNTKITLGTGTFVLQNIGSNFRVRNEGILTTVAYGTSRNDVKFALEGSTQISGGIIEWLIRIGMVKNISEANGILEKRVQNGRNEDVYFVPAFSGLYSPYWDSASRGLIIGLSHSTDRESIVNAAYEAIIFQVMDILNSMKNIRGFLNLDGGLSQNYILMQLLSNYTGRKISANSNPEITSYGTALAMISEGRKLDSELYEKYKKERKIIEPARMNAEKRYERWKEAVRRSMLWNSF